MVKERLQVNTITGKPKLMIHESCKSLINSLKMIQYDEKNPNDCAKEPHDLTHSVDSLRYGCTSYTFVPDVLPVGYRPRDFNFSNFALETNDYEVIDLVEDTDYVDMGWL
jgi:hypothetical protein